MLDLKIVNGTIIDGTGKKGYRADLGIAGDKIVALGDLSGEEAKKTIDATDKYVAPGFIDFHTHSDLSVVYDRYARSRIYSGITSDVVGNCGIGVAPIREENKQLLLDYLATRIIGTIPAKLELPWNTYGEYMTYMDEHPAAINVIPLLAQGTIRINEMGFSTEPATPEQIKNMQEEVEKAFQEGAFALTTGLTYLPGAYSNKEEIAELCKVIGKYGGYYCTHMRDEGDTIHEAIDESVYIAKEAGIPLHISHLKLCGARNFGRMDEVWQQLDEAEKNGTTVTYDLYPYAAGMTSLGALLPPWVFEGGVKEMLKKIQDPAVRAKCKEDMQNGLPDWQNFYQAAGDWSHIQVASVMTEKNKWMEGKTIQEISDETGKDGFDIMFETILAEESKVQIIGFWNGEKAMDEIIASPKAAYGSDSMSLSTEGLLSIGKPHPRAFGTVGKIFAEYVKKRGIMTFEEAVRKMTGFPASILGISDRGLLKEGYFADVTVFDPNTIADNATYVMPQQYPSGIEHVIVNGQVALENGRQTEALAGRTIKNPRRTK